MTIEVIPTGATAVVTEHHRGSHKGSRHPDRYDLSQQARVDAAAAAALAAAHTVEEMQESFYSAQKQVSDFYSASLLEAAKNAAALSVQSQKESSDLGDQATSNFNASAVQAVNIANLASVQATSNFNALSLQGVVNAAAVALQNQTLASAAAAQAAECCCELKEAIGFDGQKTRDLINSITQQDLRDRAVRSETALAAYFSAKIAPTAPVL